MEYLRKGKYYGTPQKTIQLNGIVVTDNEYTHDKVDWHYHENAYFTYLLKGRLIEINKKETHICNPGTLLFHYWQEPHYNIKPPGYARGFQVEMDKNWFIKNDIDINTIEGSAILSSPYAKNLFNGIYKETLINDNFSKLAIEGLILQVFGEMIRIHNISGEKLPLWMNKVIEILNEHYTEKISLAFLSEETGVHPVHISASFHKYLKNTISGYIRNLKIEKATQLLSDRKYSLTEISWLCGFSDQSHFIRIFKSHHGISPLKYRKLIND